MPRFHNPVTQPTDPLLSQRAGAPDSLKLKAQPKSHIKMAWELVRNAEAWAQPTIAFQATFGWHHRLSGHEFEQTPGDGEGQGSLEYCSPWGRKESNTTR